jgi:hypothetical protein
MLLKWLKDPLPGVDIFITISGALNIPSLDLISEYLSKRTDQWL